MNKLTLSLVIIGLLVAIQLGAVNAAWMFLLVGAIPGTSYSLPAGAMFILFGLIIWLVFCQPTVNHYIRQLIAHSHEAKKIATTARMPRRRYSQI